MLTLLKDPARRAAMGQVSSALARRYDWQEIIPAYRTVFEEALDRHRDSG
jgi:glycosyltransferase involved in cell wall biosynthesis